MGSNHPNCKHPARAILPHLRFLDAVAHLETPGSPDPMNSSTTGTASVYGEAEPFRAPTRAFGSPYKFSLNSKRSRREVVKGPQRKKKQKNVRLSCPLHPQPIGDFEVDGLVRGMGRLTLADDPVQASLPADDGSNISLAAAPHRSSSIFNLPHAITAPVGGKDREHKQQAVETVNEDVTAISGRVPHSRLPRDGTPLTPPGSFVSDRSPRSHPIHITPVLPSGISTAAGTTSSTGPPSPFRPCLTAIAVSLVYEVYACPDDDEADEVQTWYPIGGGMVDFTATGRGLTLGATVEV